ncbi:uncharacterized protein TRIREDRAFT_102788 [Trichoderma reesei QM6a]|uniref:Predicted protein n=1 Tax=Hypocrea jecorina (strain QM6a) TaxID=431241 RepID=G0R899_HYPJQ|nr:uncharacterized protein TRIREDRAFT_102788 [Trichoderma reesei QM6a]EGR52841.1 predicted protein [Trichoderma reesei QM6a]
MAKLEIEKLRITKPTMRTFNLEVVVDVNESPENLDWTSHLTVSLFYQPRLIASIKLGNFNIRNMVGFKAFIQHLLPNNVDNGIGDDDGLTIAGCSVDEAHELSLNIELTGITKTYVDQFRIRVFGGRVTVDFILSNVNTIQLDFGNCVFSLEKGGNVLALLDGYFDIELGGSEIVLEGDAIVADTNFSGIAILKGVKALKEGNTWIAHAIRSFEAEVNLDRKHL